MSILTLDDCRAEPLGSYLKAVGVLRLVGEQVDPHARGWWAGDRFVLSSALDRDQLATFLVDRYCPTPIVAPWNGGSGFGPSDRVDGIEALEGSSLERLSEYRRSIALARNVFTRALQQGLGKPEIVELCRGELPDEAVAWIDATVVLTREGPGYPPLLGTGGNLGRLELSNTFMQRLAEVLALRTGKGMPTRDRSLAWAKAALFGDPNVGGVAAPVGQFDPGAAGGVNSSPLGAAESVVNPWGFVLLIEGALLFASAAARRLAAGSRGRAAVPFMFEASPVGYSTGVAGETSRGEVWAPLWTRPTAVAEVIHLVGEGRVEWRGRQATAGLETAKAVASLGVDRGIDSFVRHTVVQRFGQSTIAVPAGRVRVRARRQVSVLEQLDPWIERTRRAARRMKSPPTTVADALRGMDQAAYSVATRGGADRLQQVLIAAARLEAALGRSTTFRARAELRPVTGLDATAWVPLLDDGSSEFRLAAALASMWDEDGATLRTLLRPISLPERGTGFVWADRPARAEGLGVRPIERVLGEALASRAISAVAARVPERDGPEATQPYQSGVRMGFRWGRPAGAGDVLGFLHAEVDDDRLARLLGALMLLDWRGSRGGGETGPVGEGMVPDPAWSVLVPFFHPRPVSVGAMPVHVLAESAWPRMLLAGHVQRVLAGAIRRLAIARLVPTVTDAEAIARSGPAGARLCAALLVPVSGNVVARALRRVAVGAREGG